MSHHTHELGSGGIVNEQSYWFNLGEEYDLFKTEGRYITGEK